MNLRRYISTVVLTLCLAPQSAGAQGSDFDRNTARTLWQEGRSALGKKDFVTAADRFARSDALFHAPTSLLGLAEAQVGLGKLVSAAETYNRILHDPLPAGAPPAYVKAFDAARSELAALDPRIPYVTIRITGPAAATARVTVDGITVPSAAVGVKRAIDPGKHQIRVEAPGHAPGVTTVTLAEGGAETVTLAPKPLGDATPPAPGSEAATSAPAAPAGEGGGGRRAAGLAVGGIGIVGLGIGGVLGIVTLLKSHSANGTAACTGPATPANVSDCNALRDTARGLQTGAIAAAVVGGVALGTGIALFASAPSPTEKPGVALVVNPSGGWISGRF